ncbi:class I SAM-dependent methyltransferase [Streptomonospora halotolerans]|nr:class I SAM-dependent methyltransferase [Streptomonospora nanhaiensis]
MSVPPPSPQPSAGSSTPPSGSDSRVWSRRNMTWLYDALVIHGTYRVLWGCPWRRVFALYAEAIRPGQTVLEVGPGGGYFLDRLKPRGIELHLLDVHDGPLQASAARLARHRPVTHRQSALEPFPLEKGSVDTAVLSMVLHCVPGQSVVEKAAVFDGIAAALKPGTGVCIGATVLSQGTDLSALGRAGLRYLNAKQIFANTGDTLSDLTAVLHDRFADVRLEVCGSVALWRVTAR